MSAAMTRKDFFDGMRAAVAGAAPPLANYTVEELAALLRVRPAMVLAMLEIRGPSIFPGAFRDAAEAWRVPNRAVRRYLDRAAEPMFTFQEAADFLGVHKVTVQKAAAAWDKGDKSGIKTLELMLPGFSSKRVPRIALSEVMRHVQAVQTSPPTAA